MKNALLLLVILSALTFVPTMHAQASCPAGALHCATLTWTPGAVTGNNAATSFNVYRTLTSGGCTTVTATGCTKSGSANAPASSFTDSPLAASTKYFWVITAANSAGESGPSNQVTATTAADPVTVPAAPTGVSVTAQ